MEKNIKHKEMREIVRKELKRKAEDPHRESAFRLRKKLVPPEKIDRYKRDSGISQMDSVSPNGSELTCRTFHVHILG